MWYIRAHMSEFTSYCTNTPYQWSWVWFSIMWCPENSLQTKKMSGGLGRLILHESWSCCKQLLFLWIFNNEKESWQLLISRKHCCVYAVLCWFSFAGDFWLVISLPTSSYCNTIHQPISVICSMSLTSCVRDLLCNLLEWLFWIGCCLCLQFTLFNSCPPILLFIFFTILPGCKMY